MDAKFREAADVLPAYMRDALFRLPPDLLADAEEIRLRAGRGVAVNTRGREVPVPDLMPGGDLLRAVLMRASEHSLHAVQEQLANGFLTLRGGHRIGVCGTLVTERGRPVGVRDLSSLNLRIARERRGVAEPICRELERDGPFGGLLILSPPGAGKTTFLRDMIRCLSETGVGGPPRRVSAADERFELAGVADGVPRFDLGPRTDVMSGAEKTVLLRALVRTMGPEVLAADEIAGDRDLAALEEAALCGVQLLATVHGRCREELFSRKRLLRLVEQGTFSHVLFIEVENGTRHYTLKKGGELLAEGTEHFSHHRRRDLHRSERGPDVEGTGPSAPTALGGPPAGQD